MNPRSLITNFDFSGKCIDKILAFDNNLLISIIFTDGCAAVIGVSYSDSCKVDVGHDVPQCLNYDEIKSICDNWGFEFIECLNELGLLV